jgi:hypothetical protein
MGLGLGCRIGTAAWGGETEAAWGFAGLSAAGTGAADDGGIDSGIAGTGPGTGSLGSDLTAPAFVINWARSGVTGGGGAVASSECFGTVIDVAAGNRASG